MLSWKCGYSRQLTNLLAMIVSVVDGTCMADKLKDYGEKQQNPKMGELWYLAAVVMLFLTEYQHYCSRRYQSGRTTLRTWDRISWTQWAWECAILCMPTLQSWRNRGFFPLCSILCLRNDSWIPKQTVREGENSIWSSRTSTQTIQCQVTMNPFSTVNNTSDPLWLSEVQSWIWFVT